MNNSCTFVSLVKMSHPYTGTALIDENVSRMSGNLVSACVVVGAGRGQCRARLCRGGVRDSRAGWGCAAGDGPTFDPGSGDPPVTVQPGNIGSQHSRCHHRCSGSGEQHAHTHIHTHKALLGHIFDWFLAYHSVPSDQSCVIKLSFFVVIRRQYRAE